MKVTPTGSRSRSLTNLWSASKKGFWSSYQAWNSSSNFIGVPRESSFPFISSDTFRATADVVIGNEAFPIDLESVEIPDRPAVIMIELSFIKNKGGGDAILRRIESIKSQNANRLSIVLHNGDWVPSSHYLESLSSLGADVYCVNILDGLSGVTPIPVGLENSIRRKNGVLHDFLFIHDQLREPWPSFPEKSRQIFASFKVSTNPAARQPLARKLQQSRFGFLGKRLSIRDFRAGIMSSRFVLSPPGNGPDCYRTWEAIYLGAVPIVLRNSLADSLHSELPIWAVDDWDEALTATDDQLHQKFDELVQRDRAKAYFPYWLQEVSEPR